MNCYIPISVVIVLIINTASGAVRMVNSGETIQTVINGASSGDTVKVAAGTYKESITIRNKRIILFGGYAAGFSSRDPAQNVTIIQGSTSVPVIKLLGRADSCVIDGFTICGGKHGILCDEDETWPHINGTVISNNIIRNNGNANVHGGGISLSGNNILVANNVIYGNIGNRGAGLAGGETVCIVENLIDSNYGYGDHGGGLYCTGNHTTQRNIIRRNRTGVTINYGWGGGGIMLGKCRMSGDIIYGNHAPTHGGGYFIDECSLTDLDHVLIFNNSAENGGGLYIDAGPSNCTTIANMNNCTIVNNKSSGIIIDGATCRVTMTNSIVWGNQLFTLIESPSTFSGTYNCTQSKMQGVGNIVADPLFADTASHDFHLKSAGGRWNPAAGTNGKWVTDGVTSPAIDAGDPATGAGSEPVPNGNRINLGCYGGTAEASKTTGTTGATLTDAFSTFFRFRVVSDRGEKSISVSYYVPFTQSVTLTIFDASGKKVSVPVDRMHASGEYRVTWGNRHTVAGVYVVRLMAGDFKMSTIIKIGR